MIWILNEKEQRIMNIEKEELKEKLFWQMIPQLIISSQMYDVVIIVRKQSIQIDVWNEQNLAWVFFFITSMTKSRYEKLHFVRSAISNRPIQKQQIFVQL